MILIDGVKYKLWKPGDEVKEFEPIVVEHTKDIFGEDSMYFGKEKMKTQTGIGSIPDGFIIAFDNVNVAHFHVLEIELSSHSPYKHAEPQLKKFKKAMDNPETRRQIVDAMYDQIKGDYSKEKLIKEKIGSGEVHKFLSDNITTQNTVMVIIIDEITEEWKEAFEDFPVKVKFIELKTFEREGIENLKVHAHLFEPIYSPKLEKTAEFIKKKRPEPTVRHYGGGQQKIKQITMVFNKMKDGITYQKAVKQIARDLGISPTTVADKCCRQEGLSTGEFKEKVNNAIKMGLTADEFIERVKDRSI